MNDFHDSLLKHKYAYVAIGEFKPGCFGEAQRLYERAVSTFTSGFKRSFLLQKPGTDEGIAVIIWDKIDDMVKFQETEEYQAIINQMNPLFISPPQTDFYEVCSEIEGKE